MDSTIERVTTHLKTDSHDDIGLALFRFVRLYTWVDEVDQFIVNRLRQDEIKRKHEVDVTITHFLQDILPTCIGLRLVGLQRGLDLCFHLGAKRCDELNVHIGLQEGRADLLERRIENLPQRRDKSEP